MHDAAPDPGGAAAPRESVSETLCGPAALDLPPLLDVLEARLQQLAALAEADAAGLLLVEDRAARPALRLQAQHGLSPLEEQAAALVSLDDGLAGRSVTSGETLLDGPGAPAGLSRSPWESQYAAFAVTPLQLGGRTRGALWCARRAGDLNMAPELLRLLADQFAEIMRAHLALQRVETERREIRRLADSLRDPIWTIRIVPPERTIFVSDSIETLTGYKPQDFLDDPGLWTEIVYPDDRHIVKQDVNRAEEGAMDDMHHRVRVIRKDGEMRWVHTRARVVRTDGEVRLYGTCTDVTDHVRLEEKVRRADRLSAVGMLAGGIAHEYNNLHFAILGTLDLLLMRDDLNADMRQHINRVREAAERGSEITTKLVSFARGGSGGRELLDVAELVDSTLSLVQKEFSTLGIDVQVKQSPLPVRVSGNRGELGQVLINLVINAQQAMQERPTKRLTIASGLDEDGRVFISVADTGHGIPAENQPRVFDPFFTTKGAAGSWVQDRAATDAFLAGRGLGLSVAQTIVQEHGGDIEMESEVGCGTKFTMRLPLPEYGEERESERAGVAEMRTGRILVADDEEPVREVCCELLRQMNYDVAEAAGGMEALAILEQEDFDLVLVDLQMPDMEGVELIRRINNIPSDRRPAKLIITGNIDEVPPETCAELGIAGLLQKRASLSELVSKVQLALATRKG